MNFNKFIDHTLLKQDATKAKITTLLDEAKQYNFKSVCVNPTWITYCKDQLKDSDVLVCTVIGFPLGANSIESKIFEAQDAISKGANEIDMVINVGKVIDNDYDYLVKEISSIKEIIGNNTLKVIIETCLLSDEQIRIACKAILEAKADFVKTSTGFSTSGANVRVVKLLKECVGDSCLIKAAGGVKTKTDLVEMINAGADRIGTSSGVSLMNNESSNQGY